MLLGGPSFAHHRPWIVGTTLAAGLCAGWYLLAGYGQPAWPGGSSVVGFTFGVAGGIIILFEMLLWVRKQVRAWRIGRVRTWMIAHIWLGFLSVPLLLMHSGVSFGGPLSAILLVLFLIVIASGVWGFVLQQYLPSRMLHEVHAETIASQIDAVMQTYVQEVEELVEAVCGPPEGATPLAVEDRAPTVLTLPTLRVAGSVQGKALETVRLPEPVPGADRLRVFFHERVVPYLLAGAKTGSALREPTDAARAFEDVRSQLPAAAHGVLAALEALCEQRRQLDLQQRLHFWLHSWLWVHFPLSVALVILMFVHVWTALEYW